MDPRRDRHRRDPGRWPGRKRDPAAVQRRLHRSRFRVGAGRGHPEPRVPHRQSEPGPPRHRPRGNGGPTGRRRRRDGADPGAERGTEHPEGLLLLEPGLAPAASKHRFEGSPGPGQDQGRRRRGAGPREGTLTSVHTLRWPDHRRGGRAGRGVPTGRVPGRTRSAEGRDDHLPRCHDPADPRVRKRGRCRASPGHRGARRGGHPSRVTGHRPAHPRLDLLSEPDHGARHRAGDRLQPVHRVEVPGGGASRAGWARRRRSDRADGRPDRPFQRGHRGHLAGGPPDLPSVLPPFVCLRWDRGGRPGPDRGHRVPAGAPGSSRSMGGQADVVASHPERGR